TLGVFTASYVLKITSNIQFTNSFNLPNDLSNFIKPNSNDSYMILDTSPRSTFLAGIMVYEKAQFYYSATQRTEEDKNEEDKIEEDKIKEDRFFILKSNDLTVFPKLLELFAKTPLLKTNMKDDSNEKNKPSLLVVDYGNNEVPEIKSEIL